MSRQSRAGLAPGLRTKSCGTAAVIPVRKSSYVTKIFNRTSSSAPPALLERQALMLARPHLTGRQCVRKSTQPVFRIAVCWTTKSTNGLPSAFVTANTLRVRKKSRQIGSRFRRLPNPFLAVGYRQPSPTAINQASQGSLHHQEPLPAVLRRSIDPGKHLSHWSGYRCINPLP